MIDGEAYVKRVAEVEAVLDELRALSDAEMRQGIAVAIDASDRAALEHVTGFLLGHTGNFNAPGAAEFVRWAKGKVQ